ncbi:MAG TPA: response regulator [Bacteroidota bacterium]|nr:response regulator [Bacteroidota bacterium]
MTKRKQILIIDDEVTWLSVLKEILLQRGYEVKEAHSGAEALKELATYKPDLILSDIRMPDMNGFDLLSKIKTLPKMSKTPFVFLSAIDDFHARKVAKELGASDYVSKPMNTEDIASLLSKFLPR